MQFSACTALRSGAVNVSDAELASRLLDDEGAHPLVRRGLPRDSGLGEVGQATLAACRPRSEYVAGLVGSSLGEPKVVVPIRTSFDAVTRSVYRPRVFVWRRPQLEFDAERVRRG